MAAVIFQCDATKSPMAEVIAAARGMRDHYTRLKNARAAMISYSSGGTGTAANWPLLAAACAFQAAGYADANTAAQAAFAELDTFYTKVSAGADGVEAALLQLCGKLGV